MDRRRDNETRKLIRHLENLMNQFGCDDCYIAERLAELIQKSRTKKVPNNASVQRRD